MAGISKKVHESRLKWYGHVMRREEGYVGKTVVNGDGCVWEHRLIQSPPVLWLVKSTVGLV